VKIGTYLLRGGVGDWGRRIPNNRGRFFSCVASCPQLQPSQSLEHIWVSLNPSTHSTCSFLNTMCSNATRPITNQVGECWPQRWYYVVGVTTIPCLGFEVIINIVSKKENSYHVTIGDMPQCTCLDFNKMSSHALGKNGNECIANTHTMCLDFFFNGKRIARTTSLFTLQCKPTMKSCDYSSLPTLLSTSSDGSIMFTQMFEHVNLPIHVMFTSYCFLFLHIFCMQ
jgi:hypothetical protein